MRRSESVPGAADAAQRVEPRRESIQREAIAELRRVIGFDRWCWLFADPQTLIPLSGLAEHDYGPGLARSLELEYSGDDYATMGALARRTVPVASLSAETRRDLARSPRWDEILRPVGIGDEAALACRDALGCWGWIKAYRNIGDPAFSDDDLELLARSARASARRSGAGSAARSLAGAAAERARGDRARPGSARGQLDRRARNWVEALPAAEPFTAWGCCLPRVSGGCARAIRNGAKETHALQRAVDGRWVEIEAAPLDGQGGGRIAVVLRSAAPAETFELLCRAYALTTRERQVVAALIAGPTPAR